MSITRPNRNINKCRNQMKYFNSENKFTLTEFPEDPVVHVEYRNPKDPLHILPLVPRSGSGTGTSHVILPGVCSLDCNYGPDRNKANKKKWVEKKMSQKGVDHSQTAAVAKLIIQCGHKVDCPAKICITETFCLENEWMVSSSDTESKLTLRFFPVMTKFQFQFQFPFRKKTSQLFG